MGKTVEFYFDVGQSGFLSGVDPAAALVRGGRRRAGLQADAAGRRLPGHRQRLARRPFRPRAATRCATTQRHARKYGVPYVNNPHFPIITLFLMRAVTGVQLREPQRLQDLLAAVFKAMWIDALDLNQPALTAKTLQDAGFAPEAIQALAADPEVKAALKATTDEAVARGVFGAPTSFVGDEMFFGQDRMDMIRDELAR